MPSAGTTSATICDHSFRLGSFPYAYSYFPASFATESFEEGTDASTRKERQPPQRMHRGGKLGPSRSNRSSRKSIRRSKSIKLTKLGAVCFLSRDTRGEKRCVLKCGDRAASTTGPHGHTRPPRGNIGPPQRTFQESRSCSDCYSTGLAYGRK